MLMSKLSKIQKNIYPCSIIQGTSIKLEIKKMTENYTFDKPGEAKRKEGVINL